ncbi:MAG: hypothetical protein BGO98_01970 [Myxococcales bacterium 68-20]|nr:MAG: hypothetical protein BGO98_01970 [Myxococcales bacterium 68-20]
MRRMAFFGRRDLWLAGVLVFGVRAVGCAATGENAPAHAGPDERGGETLPGSPVTDASTSDGSGSDGSTPEDARCSEDGWCRVEMPNDKVALYGIWGSSANDVWAVGSGGAVFHWNGVTWSQQPLLTEAGQPKPLFGIWGSGPNDVWAFGVNEIFHADGWNDTATVWSRIEAPKLQAFTPTSARAIWGSSATDVWLLLAPLSSFSSNTLNKCWHSDGWSGATTKLTAALDHYIAGNPANNFAGIWGTGPNDIWIVGASGRILHTDGYWNRAAEWTQTNSNTRQHLTGVWGTATDDVWAVGENGTIRHYAHDEGGDLRWLVSDSTITTHLRAVWGTSATNVWAIGDENTILHGDGSSWSRSMVPSLPPSTPFYGIWGSGPDDVWVVGERVILHRGPARGAK